MAIWKFSAVWEFERNMWKNRDCLESLESFFSRKKRFFLTNWKTTFPAWAGDKSLLLLMASQCWSSTWHGAVRRELIHKPCMVPVWCKINKYGRFRDVSDFMLLGNGPCKKKSNIDYRLRGTTSTYSFQFVSALSNRGSMDKNSACISTESFLHPVSVRHLGIRNHWQLGCS